MTLWADLNEGADSDLAVEGLFQRVGTEYEKAHWPLVLVCTGEISCIQVSAEEH